MCTTVRYWTLGEHIATVNNTVVPDHGAVLYFEDQTKQPSSGLVKMRVAEIHHALRLGDNPFDSSHFVDVQLDAVRQEDRERLEYWFRQKR